MSVTRIRALARLVAVAAALASSVLCAGAAPAGAAAPPAQPAQPTSGPGGNDYQWSNPALTPTTVAGNDDYSYWVEYPTHWDRAGAAPTKLPVVVFNHGYAILDGLGNSPSNYKPWLDHLARKGNIVIFPKYQSTLTLGAFYTPNAIWAVKDALAKAFVSTAVKPDTARGMTIIGHSAGGRVSLDMASQAAASGLPVPRAILAVNPADTSAWMPLADSYAGIPSSTKVVCVVDDADQNVGREGCDLTWDRIGQIPAANKNYVWMFGDGHGSPALVADHFAAGRADALDFYGFWKLGDGLRDCTMLGSNCGYALGNTDAQKNMGLWGDKVPVRRMAVSTIKPVGCPAGSTAKHCGP